MKKASPLVFFFSLFVCLGLLLSLLFQHLENSITLPTSQTKERSPVIVLDAGHGGEDGGATGVNGILEKDLNLSLTNALAALLRGAGYTVVQTRTEDRLLYDANAKKGHKKQSDLENRLKIAEKYENAVFISIHMNTFPQESCQGMQVWYSQNDASSKVLADALQSRVRSLLQPQNNRRTKAATSSIYLLKKAKCPAVLVECGFLSNAEECALLSEPSYRQKLALVLFDAICLNLERGTCESAENGV